MSGDKPKVTIHFNSGKIITVDFRPADVIQFMQGSCMNWANNPCLIITSENTSVVIPKASVMFINIDFGGFAEEILKGIS